VTCPFCGSPEGGFKGIYNCNSVSQNGVTKEHMRGLLCLRTERDALKARIEQLEDWKQSALAVEREWNANAIATMLGGKPGESQREVIQREVPKLLARIKRLEEAGDALKTAGYFGGWGDAVNKWVKVREGKL